MNESHSATSPRSTAKDKVQKPSAKSTAVPESEFYASYSFVPSAESIPGLLRSLAASFEKRIFTWKYPPRDEEDDSRPDYDQIYDRRLRRAFQSLSCDLGRAKFSGVILWLKAHFPVIGIELDDRIKRLCELFPVVDGDCDHYEVVLGELSAAQLHLVQIAEVLTLSRAVNDTPSEMSAQRPIAKSPKSSRQELNVTARKVLKGKPPKGKMKWTCRDLARSIGCSPATASKLDAFRAYHADQSPSSRLGARTVNLTGNILATQSNELERLIDEQRADDQEGRGLSPRVNKKA